MKLTCCHLQGSDYYGGSDFLAENRSTHLQCVIKGRMGPGIDKLISYLVGSSVAFPDDHQGMVL